MSGFDSRGHHFILVCNQPPRSRLSLLPFVAAWKSAYRGRVSRRGWRMMLLLRRAGSFSVGDDGRHGKPVEVVCGRQRAPRGVDDELRQTGLLCQLQHRRTVRAH